MITINKRCCMWTNNKIILDIPLCSQYYKRVSKCHQNNCLLILDRSSDITTCFDSHLGHLQANILHKINCNCIHNYTRVVRKVKNVCAYNPHSCFIVPNQSFGVFSRVQRVTWCSWCSELFHVVSVTGCDNERADIKSRRL